jgi:hypothetical protein
LSWELRTIPVSPQKLCGPSNADVICAAARRKAWLSIRQDGVMPYMEACSSAMEKNGQTGGTHVQEGKNRRVVVAKRRTAETVSSHFGMALASQFCRPAKRLFEPATTRNWRLVYQIGSVP